MTLAREDGASPPLLFLGRIVKTQGLKGEVRVQSGGEPGNFPAGMAVQIQSGAGKTRNLTVRSSRPHRQLAIVSFREIQDIEGASELVGSSLWVEKANLQELPPDEFYWHQLIGLNVRTEGGEWIGTLEEIFPTGSNDVYVVRKDGREILLPATDEVVKEVDLPGRCLVIRVLEGLLPQEDDI